MEKPASHYVKFGIVILIVAAAIWAGTNSLGRQVGPVGGKPYAQTDFTPLPLTATYTLTDQNGAKVSSAGFMGKYQLLYFGFTYCPDICPTGLQRMAATHQMLGKLADQTALVFITIDPVRDTPTVIKDYLAMIDAPITGLTGSEQQVHAVADGYKITYQKNDDKDPDYTMLHTDAIFLLDKEGRTRKIFRDEAPPEDMANAVRYLSKQ